METVYAYGVHQMVCDSVLSITNDGCVYKLNDEYYHSTYKTQTSPGQTTQIVWLEKKTFTEANRSQLSSKSVGCMLSEGDEWPTGGWEQDLGQMKLGSGRTQD